jgi:hypothetical protein
MGQQIVAAFGDVGLPVTWSGSEDARPVVDLRVID